MFLVYKYLFCCTSLSTVIVYCHNVFVFNCILDLDFNSGLTFIGKSQYCNCNLYVSGKNNFAC